MKNGNIWAAEIVCRNETCPDRGKPNVRRFGKTRSGVQRYQCKRCKRTFTRTKGTLFYNLHTSPETILDCFALLAQGNSPAEIRACKGIKEETLLSWLQAATEHVPEVETMLARSHRLQRSQLQALWAVVDGQTQQE